MVVTLWEMKTKTWQEMEQNSDSTTYNTNRVRDMINEVSQEFLEGKVSNELTGKYIQLNVLNFNKWKFAITIIDSLTITAPIVVWDITVSVDTTTLPAIGAVMIWNEIIAYTSKNATTLLWVTGILSAHKSWDTVIPLYSVPTDYWKSVEVYSFLQNQKQVVSYRDSNGQLVRYYEEMSDWTTKYINFFWMMTDDVYYIDYTKTYELLVDDVDESIFPDYMSLNIIPFIAWGRMIKDEILRAKLLTQWYNKLATEWIKAGEEVGKPKNIQWKRYSFSSIN